MLDELVAYALKLPRDKPDEKKLPGGTYENFMIFVQEITEAAKLSRSSMVVGSLLESKNEYDTLKGKNALPWSRSVLIDLRRLICRLKQKKALKSSGADYF